MNTNMSPEIQRLQAKAQNTKNAMDIAVQVLLAEVASGKVGSDKATDMGFRFHNLTEVFLKEITSYQDSLLTEVEKLSTTSPA